MTVCEDCGMKENNAVDCNACIVTKAKAQTISEIISSIDAELANTISSTDYLCENGDSIHTDIGYISEWWDEYRLILMKKVEKLFA